MKLISYIKKYEFMVYRLYGFGHCNLKLIPDSRENNLDEEIDTKPYVRQV